MKYSEFPMLELIGSADKLHAERYLAANPDLRAANVDASEHFNRYGVHEGRLQFIDPAKIKKLRSQKLARVKFRMEPTTTSLAGEPMDFLTPEVRDNFEIPEFPPVSANDYHEEVIETIRRSPEKLFLDVGAGLRHTYYSNVINAEIYHSQSTDVLCVSEKLPFSDNQFDAVFCLAVLEHTKQPWLATEEIIRVTKPDGIIRIDWPFLQPVHGYPHHYFNATPKGNVSQFANSCDILACDVRPWQHPIFALAAILREWKSGLPNSEQSGFDQMTVADFLSAPPEAHLANAYCSELDVDVQAVIACGTTLIARKRP